MYTRVKLELLHMKPYRTVHRDGYMPISIQHMLVICRSHHTKIVITTAIVLEL